MRHKQILGLAVAAALVLPLAGCFQHTYDIGTGAPEGEIVYKNWHHHWVFGLIRPKLQKVLEVDKHCPSGNATIHEERSFVNGLVDVLIGIVYSPTTVTIRCADGSEAQVEVTEDQAAELAADPAFLEVVAVMAPERLEATRLAISRLGVPDDARGPGVPAK